MKIKESELKLIIKECVLEELQSLDEAGPYEWGARFVPGSSAYKMQKALKSYDTDEEDEEAPSTTPTATTEPGEKPTATTEPGKTPTATDKPGGAGKPLNSYELKNLIKRELFAHLALAKNMDARIELRKMIPDITEKIVKLILTPKAPPGYRRPKPHGVPAPQPRSRPGRPKSKPTEDWGGAKAWEALERK